MGITELINEYGAAGVIFGFVVTWIIFGFQIKGMKDNTNTRIDGMEKNTNTRIDGMEKNINTRIDGIETSINIKMEAINKSIEKYDREQKELRDLVMDIKLLMERQQDQTDNKQTAPDGSTL